MRHRTRMFWAALLLATGVLSQALAAGTAPPTDEQYRDWISIERSRIRARIAEWDSLEWQLKDFTGRAQNPVTPPRGKTPGRNLKPPEPLTKSEIEAMDKLRATATSGRAYEQARLSVLDRLSQKLTPAQLRAAGPGFLMVGSVAGQVTASRGGAAEALTEDRALKPGDAVMTGPASSALLMLLDGSWLTLGPQTTLRVVGAAERPAYELASGALHRRLDCIVIDSSRSCGAIFQLAGVALGQTAREFAIVPGAEGGFLLTLLEGEMALRDTAGHAASLYPVQALPISASGAFGTAVGVNRNEVKRWWLGQ